MRHKSWKKTARFLAVCLLSLTTIAGVWTATGYNGFTIYLPFTIKQGSQPTPEPTGVVILSSNAFVPYEGSTDVYIVGEVQNNTDTNVELVMISTVLRDIYGNIVDSDFTYSEIEILEPGMRSPFMNIIYEPLPYSSVENTVSWSTTTDSPYLLEIIERTPYFDSYASFHVEGEVRNQYSQTRTFVKAFVTLYDAEGKVIGTDYSYTDNYDIAPGETDTFHAEVYFWVGKPDLSRVVYYDLQVVGD